MREAEGALVPRQTEGRRQVDEGEVWLDQAGLQVGGVAGIDGRWRRRGFLLPVPGPWRARGPAPRPPPREVAYARMPPQLSAQRTSAESAIDASSIFMPAAKANRCRNAPASRCANCGLSPRVAITRRVTAYKSRHWNLYFAR